MKPLRLLIVDDNEMNATIAEVALSADGFEVKSAIDAIEARQQVAAFLPDVILMDIQMPVVDGLMLTREFKVNPATKHIVVIAFTSFAMRGDESKLRAAGCDGYLSKPIDVKRFADQVRACLVATEMKVISQR